MQKCFTKPKRICLLLLDILEESESLVLFVDSLIYFLLGFSIFWGE